MAIKTRYLGTIQNQGPNPDTLRLAKFNLDDPGRPVWYLKSYDKALFFETLGLPTLNHPRLAT